MLVGRAMVDAAVESALAMPVDMHANEIGAARKILERIIGWLTARCSNARNAAR